MDYEACLENSAAGREFGTSVRIAPQVGHPVMADGTRLKGEVFFDESMQKILAAGGVLSEFSDRIKYPRTHHAPWSEGMHGDDRRISSMEALIRRRVIVTEKKDGENTTLYTDGMHARSLDGRHNDSRNWVKGMVWARIAADLPVGWRVCGENLYAKHSIAYDDLLSYFLGSRSGTSATCAWAGTRLRSGSSCLES